MKVALTSTTTIPVEGRPGFGTPHYAGEVVELPTEQAERLVRLGVAVKATSAKPKDG